MSAKRIRCECGRVYEPAKNATCPACGASPIVAENIPPKLPGEEKIPEDQKGDSTPQTFSINGRMLAIIGGVLLALILVVVAVRKSKPGEKKGDVVVQPTPSPNESSSPFARRPPPTVIVIPPSNGNQNTVVGQAFDLAAAIASAPAGATIKVPPGAYPGGLVLSKAIQIVASGGAVMIQSDGRECISVRASGVALQGVQFFCNGIGELPAISIAEGSDLSLDGCRVQSGTGVGIALTGNASIKSIGTTFTASNGIALRMQGGKGNFTQCTFTDSKYALNATNGASLEFQSCAFDRMGANGDGGIVVLNGPGTSANGTDCHFAGNSGAIWATDGASFTITSSTFKENGVNMNAASMNGLIALRKGGHAVINRVSFTGNRQGVSVGDGSTLEMTQCGFAGNGLVQTRQTAIPSFPLSVYGQGSSATVRNTTFGDSTQYAVVVMNGANLTLEDVEIYNSHNAAVIVGDRNGPAAHAEIRGTRLHHNDNALGIFAGSSVTLEDSEIRDNNEGITVSDRDSHLEMKKGGAFGNRDHGLVVLADASASATESEFRNNARGAQSGMPKKSAGRGSMTLSSCTIGGNHVFGVGAHALSELILLQCAFDGTDKTNIYRDRSAVVKTDAVPSDSPTPSPSSSPSEETSPSPNESPAPSASPQRHPRPTPRPRRHEDDAARILRHIFGPR